MNPDNNDFLGCDPTEKQLLSAIYGIVAEIERKIDRLEKNVALLKPAPLIK
jgi:hypothetical protein